MSTTHHPQPPTTHKPHRTQTQGTSFIFSRDQPVCKTLHFDVSLTGSKDVREGRQWVGCVLAVGPFAGCPARRSSSKSDLRRVCAPRTRSSELLVHHRCHLQVGILTPDWLKDAKYLGQTATDNFVTDVFSKAEFINYYADKVCWGVLSCRGLW